MPDGSGSHIVCVARLLMTARVSIGISGWRYAPWRGVFYPPGQPEGEELA